MTPKLRNMEVQTRSIAQKTTTKTGFLHELLNEIHKDVVRRLRDDYRTQYDRVIFTPFVLDSIPWIEDVEFTPAITENYKVTGCFAIFFQTYKKVSLKLQINSIWDMLTNAVAFTAMRPNGWVRHNAYVPTPIAVFDYKEEFVIGFCKEFVTFLDRIEDEIRKEHNDPVRFTKLFDRRILEALMDETDLGLRDKEPGPNSRIKHNESFTLADVRHVLNYVDCDVGGEDDSFEDVFENVKAAKTVGAVVNVFRARLQNTPYKAQSKK